MKPNFDLYSVPTPCYVVDIDCLRKNLEILRDVADRAECKILLAQKAFSMFALYPLIGQYLDGTTASGLFEAKLGREEMGKETHVFSTAYRPDEMDEILFICDHVIFNSFSQWEKYRDRAIASGKQLGLRINPECSTGDHAIYDPCAPGSRLGITQDHFKPGEIEGISGLHFHSLCEQNADALIETLTAVEQKFGAYLHGMRWVNFGGGHHITRANYDRASLIDCVHRFKEQYNVDVYLEPGEAVALNVGYLVTTVLDVIENSCPIAILDTSAACHMPDVIEMPYRPPLCGSGLPDERAYTYKLGGPTCLAGDIIGDYSFNKPLQAGDRLAFSDMAIYSMVKNNTFNGMGLPAIAICESGQVNLVKSFGYADFKQRLS